MISSVKQAADGLVGRQEAPSDALRPPISRKLETERLWKGFSRDPSQWQDKSRSNRTSDTPELRLKLRRELFWSDGWRNSSWVRQPTFRLKQEMENQDADRSDNNGNHETPENWPEFTTLEAMIDTVKSGSLVDFEIAELIQILDRCQREQHEACACLLFSCLCRWGLDASDPLGNFFVPVLVELKNMHEAQKVFDKLDRQNEYSWTCLLNGYTKAGKPQYALQLFDSMLKLGAIQPTGYTYVAVLKACSELQDVRRGTEIHEMLSSTDLLSKDLFVGNALVDMYAKGGCLTQAQAVFDTLPVRDVVSWNVLASGYYQNGQNQEALDCIDQMEAQGFVADAISYVARIKACANSGAIDLGQLTHADMVMKGLPVNSSLLGSALVDMYGKCGLLWEAKYVFDVLSDKDAVSWTSLILGYTNHGQGEEALKCFDQMQAAGISPTAVTYVCSLKACASIGALDKAEELHARIDKEGLLMCHGLVSSSLVSLYAKWGQLTKAQEVFKKIPVPDIVAWTAIISGCTEQGLDEEALECFDQMLQQRFAPDAVVSTCALKACGGLGAIDRGRQMHAVMEKCGLAADDHRFGNAVVDFYAKCGCLLDAQHMFDKFSVQNVVTWTALIAGYAQNGSFLLALEAFETMMSKGVRPNLVTFVTMINACCHAGNVEKGEEYFKVMSRGYGLIPTVEIYASMIDLFGRSGLLVKSLGLIEEMPYQVDSTVWHVLLGACQVWENVELGCYTFERLMQLDPFDQTAFISMGNIYLNSGMHEAAEKIEALSLQRQSEKQLLNFDLTMVP